MAVVIVRLSKARENEVCDEAPLLQGLDYVQADKNALFLRHHTFCITSKTFNLD